MAAADPTEISSSESKKDREEILNHIRSIFEAYIARDASTIRRTHSDDWVGFLSPSTRIERGIHDYMSHAERSLRGSARGTGYELLDTEVQVYGDLALVYYIARWDKVDAGGKGAAVFLRALDVYRRDKAGWIQCGSHITGVPQGEVALDGTRSP